MTRRKHRTLQSKHVRGADDKPVISPVSWGPGFLSLYKGTSILLMFASKHLSPLLGSVRPLWMGARSGSQHHRIGLLGPARDRATSNCHNDHFIRNQFGLSRDKGAAEPCGIP